jgi:osmoprotectant transport system permease protein
VSTVLLAAAPVIPGSGAYGKTDSCVTDNKTFCWNWFKDRWGGDNGISSHLIEHIQLAAIAVVVGFVISFGLALLAYRARWLTAPITFVASLLYTVPSLAAFYILVPVTGINTKTVEIALISYTLLILFTNTLAGLTGVSEEIKDAARGNGMTRTQSLWRVELPLAVPTIIAGLRVAAVTIISLVTVAGLIVPDGLGYVIFAQGLQNNNFSTALLAGGVLCILLALAADAVLAAVQRLVTPWASARRVR